MIHNNLAYCYFLLEYVEFSIFTFLPSPLKLLMLIFISIFRRDEEAAEHYDKALELTPMFIRALLNKALLHLYRSEFVQVRLADPISSFSPRVRSNEILLFIDSIVL